MRVEPKDILGLLAQLPGLIASGSFNINDQETSSTTQTYSINKILALIAASGAGDMLKSDNLSGLANNDTALANIGAGTGTGGGRDVFKANDAAAIRALLLLGTAAQAALDNDGALTANSTTAVPTQQAIRSYVEGKIAGVAWKANVRAATTTATPLASVVPGFVMDTVTLAAGDDYLDKDNGDQALRGIYTVQSSGPPVRRGDANTIARLVNATVYVSEGAAVSAGGNLDTQWTCTVNKSATLGTSPIIWVRTGAGGVLLGTDVGSIVQAYDADLAAIAALATTPFGRGLLTLADAAAVRSAINAASLAANTFTGKQTLPASAAASAGLNLGQGAAPDSPANGDVWVTPAGIYVRVNGATVGPLSAGGGATLREQDFLLMRSGNQLYGIFVADKAMSVVVSCQQFNNTTDGALEYSTVSATSFDGYNSLNAGQSSAPIALAIGQAIYLRGAAGSIVSGKVKQQ